MFQSHVLFSLLQVMATMIRMQANFEIVQWGPDLDPEYDYVRLVLNNGAKIHESGFGPWVAAAAPWEDTHVDEPF